MADTAEIKFGTSGWRAVMAEEFTFANVGRALRGIARYVRSEKPGREIPRLLVGRDPRFLGETLVGMASEILAEHGISALVIAEPAPTPAIAHGILQAKAHGAINFTASHNPPEYNGIKFSTPDGAPALPEVTKKIEAEISRAGAEESPINIAEKAKSAAIDVKEAYLKRLREIVDFDVVQKSKLKVVFDPLWGAARGYSDRALKDAGVQVQALHDWRDVLFGGHAPEPEGELLNDLRQRMKDAGGGAKLGIATDGDADRFGVLDADGAFISPNYIIALLFDYLVESRGWKNGVAKSVVTTSLIGAVARRHNVELHETPVGFKYIGELIKQDKIAIGGEESAGLSIRHHVPEKDGVLAGLLCCEMVARRGKTLKQQLNALFAEVGSFYPRRDNFRLTEELKAKLTEKLRSDPREFSGRKVVSTIRADGLKLLFEDGAWVCYRLSGTEPVVRIYSEARSEGDLEKLSAAARQWVMQ